MIRSISAISSSVMRSQASRPASTFQAAHHVEQFAADRRSLNCAHPGAAIGQELDQPFGGQDLERLTQGRARDAEASRRAGVRARGAPSARCCPRRCSRAARPGVRHAGRQVVPGPASRRRRHAAFERWSLIGIRRFHDIRYSNAMRGVVRRRSIHCKPIMYANDASIRWNAIIAPKPSEEHHDSAAGPPFPANSRPEPGSGPHPAGHGHADHRSSQRRVRRTRARRCSKAARRSSRPPSPVVIYPVLRAPAPGRPPSSIRSSPGDTVLMAETGHFATLWRQIAARFGIEVDFMPGDWRRGADPGRDRGRSWPQDHGARHQGRDGRPQRDLHRLDQPHRRDPQGDRQAPAIRPCFMVDTISSLASVDYRHDEWQVDVTVIAARRRA